MKLVLSSIFFIIFIYMEFGLHENICNLNLNNEIKINLNNISV